MNISNFVHACSATMVDFGAARRRPISITASNLAHLLYMWSNDSLLC